MSKKTSELDVDRIRGRRNCWGRGVAGVPFENEQLALWCGLRALGNRKVEGISIAVAVGVVGPHLGPEHDTILRRRWVGCAREKDLKRINIEIRGSSGSTYRDVERAGLIILRRAVSEWYHARWVLQLIISSRETSDIRDIQRTVCVMFVFEAGLRTC
jgi:hypothetical protein